MIAPGPQVWITPGDNDNDNDTVDVAYRFLAPPEGVDVAQPILQTGHTIAAGASASGTAQAPCRWPHATPTRVPSTHH